MKNRKIILISEILLLLAIFCIGTCSYLIDSKAVINKADNGHSEIKIIEKISGPPANNVYPAGYTHVKNVTIQNLKDKSYVRCYIESSDASITEEGYCQLNFGTNRNWIKDGEYWYYKIPLKTGEITPPLLESISFFVNMPVNLFEIIVYAESVQAEGYTDCKAAFNSIN